MKPTPFLLALVAFLSICFGVIVASQVHRVAYADGLSSVDAGAPAIAAAPAPSVAATQAVGIAAAPAPTPAIAPAPAKDAPGILWEIVSDVRSGQWRLAAAAALALVMLALGTARERTGWFSGDRGGAALVLLLALSGSFGTALASGAAINFDLILGAIGVAFTGAGGYAVIKKLIWPSDAKPAA